MSAPRAYNPGASSAPKSGKVRSRARGPETWTTRPEVLAWPASPPRWQQKDIRDDSRMAALITAGCGKDASWQPGLSRFLQAHRRMFERSWSGENSRQVLHKALPSFGISPIPAVHRFSEDSRNPHNAGEWQAGAMFSVHNLFVDF